MSNLYSIGRKRIRTVQDKMKNGESLIDGREKHGNQPIKLTENVLTLIHDHFNSLPSSTSRYGLEVLKLNYFDDPSLNLRILYELFLDYYAAITNHINIPIEKKTYEVYFNHYVNYSFRLPRTDVCNLCYAYETNGEQKDKDAYDTHKGQIDDFRKMKDSMFAAQNVLHCEFDFGQNLPLPKLPVNAQFFLRLLWLYIFNVHMPASNRSYMFHLMGGSLKNGANTVCNPVYHVIRKEFELDYYNQIFLYSDAAGGGNRNYEILLFFSILAVLLQIQIQHSFPVRGHSYCQCDRNFGLYGSKKKVTEKEYVGLIKSARDPPFEMLDATKCGVKNFENILIPDKQLLSKIKISKVVKIVYFPNGYVDFTTIIMESRIPSKLKIL